MDSKPDKHERDRAWRRMKDLQRPTIHLFVGMLIAIALAGFALAQQDRVDESISEYFRGVGAIQRGDLEEAAKALRQAIARFEKQEFTKGEFMARFHCRLSVPLTVSWRVNPFPSKSSHQRRNKSS